MELLDDPWFGPETTALEEAMRDSKGSFFIPAAQIQDVEFDPTSKWGMGRIPHSGKLRIKLKNGTRRELILLLGGLAAISLPGPHVRSRGSACHAR